MKIETYSEDKIGCDWLFVYCLQLHTLFDWLLEMRSKIYIKGFFIISCQLTFILNYKFQPC